MNKYSKLILTLIIVVIMSFGSLIALTIVSHYPSLYKSPYEMRNVTVSVGKDVLYKGPKYGVDIYESNGFHRIDILGGLFHNKVVDSYTAGIIDVKFNDDVY